MYLVAIAWIYVVLMMSVAEALHSQGSVLGAIVTFVLYGVLPLSLVLYVMGTPMRRRQRRLQSEEPPTGAAQSPDGDGDGSSHPAGAAVAPERKEP